ncbi:aspartate kinase [Rufibacter quisquiliarum]|uniref:Aspartokinase n=1 Tax=Rufibacter quisquiliarum TaxID=1549639 RepID=A0A839GL38_9BACT|nr:aspartate kinase [Rufibacter quisquiliarum]MBA9079562.1 aspartokinase/homoserine dehydrogenase 1 [Rufibacter quisquiliarum]
MLVLKFGGTSVANADAIRQLISIIQAKDRSEKKVVVVSAMSKVTDLLISLYQRAAAHDASYQEILEQLEAKHMAAIEELIPMSHQIDIKGKIKMIFREMEDVCKGIFLLDELSDSTKARMMAYGERLSSAIVSVAFQHHGLSNTLLDSRDYLQTDSNYLNAKVNLKVTYTNIQQSLPEDLLYVAPGFIARSAEGKTTVLGRGGSDYTASLYAAALQADLLEIWSDVDGMYTTDPRKASAAFSIEELSYEEAMELAYFGAKVLYPPTIAPLIAAKIPLVLKNTFNPGHKGTLITASPAPSRQNVKGISCIDHMAVLTLSGSGMVGVPGVAMRLFKAVAQESINVYFITQSSSEQSITIGLAETEGAKAVHALTAEFAEDIAQELIHPVSLETPMSIVAMVGNGMIQQPGIAGKAFSLLGDHGINIRAIAQGATERIISVVVRSEDAHQAVNLLHDRFFLTKPAQAEAVLA